MSKLFIADAGYNVGYGHYYRTKSLVSYLRETRDDIHFYASEEASSSGLEYPDGYLDPEGEDVLRLAENIDANTIYFDGHFDQDFLMKGNLGGGLSVVSYQNLSDNVYPSIYVSPYDNDPRTNNYSKSSKYNTYEGLKYFIIRDQVREIKKDMNNSKSPYTIAFTAGGSDPYRFTEEFCSCAKSCSRRDLEFNVYVGSHMPEERVKKIKDKFDTYNINILYFHLGSLLDSSLVVVPLSVTAFELLYLNKAVSVFNLPEKLDLEHIFSSNPPLYSLDDISASFGNSVNHVVGNVNEIIHRVRSALHSFSELDGLAHKRIAQIIAR